MKNIFVALFFLSLALSCDATVNPDKVPAPDSITFSAEELVFTTTDAARLPITITSPTRPSVTIPKDATLWLSYKDAPFKDYKMEGSFSVTRNDSFDKRIAYVTVSAPGVPSVTLRISQEGKSMDSRETPSIADMNAMELSRALRLGWNMGNHFDAYHNNKGSSNYNYPSETAWGGIPATQTTFLKLREAGFSSVRAPVTWLNMIGPAPDYTIDKSWIDRVYEVVQYAHKAGLYVIINTHHDENHGDDHWLDIKGASDDSALNESIKAKIKGVWTNIANRFADCGDWLIMEGFNELNDGGWGWSADFRANPGKQTGILNEWNQVFVDAVRATGGNNATRWLGVPTYCANPEFEKYLVLPSDKAGRLMISVHFYDPSEYTIGEKQYSDWGHTGATGRKANGADEDHVQSVFGKLYDKYVSKGIPVYVGEFGCSMRSRSDTRAWSFYMYYMEYIAKAAKTYYLPCFLWDNGAQGTGRERHGYINHGNGEYVGNSKEVLDVLARAWSDEDPSYTLQSIYDRAPKF